MTHYWPADLQQPCPNCRHQQGAHTHGANTRGWAIYDPVWRDALGGCTTPGCHCATRRPPRNGNTGKEAA